jgi:hypothetical protein
MDEILCKQPNHCKTFDINVFIKGQEIKLLFERSQDETVLKFLERRHNIRENQNVLKEKTIFLDIKNNFPPKSFFFANFLFYFIRECHKKQ